MRDQIGRGQEMQTRTNAKIEQEIGLRLKPGRLLPHYLDHHRMARSLDPAKRLMIAVLREAMTDFEENVLAKRKTKRNLYRQAKDWIFDEAEDWLFSFENICRCLGLNPNDLRYKLLRSGARKLRFSTWPTKYRRANESIL
jgi:hypothetical protein